MAGFLGCMGDVHHPLDITRVIGGLGTGVPADIGTEFQSTLRATSQPSSSSFTATNVTGWENREVTQVTETRFPLNYCFKWIICSN